MHKHTTTCTHMGVRTPFAGWLRSQAVPCTFPGMALPGVAVSARNALAKMLQNGHRWWVNRDMDSPNLANLGKKALLAALAALAEAAKAPAGTPGACKPLRNNRRRHALLEMVKVRFGAHARDPVSLGRPVCAEAVPAKGGVCSAWQARMQARRLPLR